MKKIDQKPTVVRMMPEKHKALRMYCVENDTNIDQVLNELIDELLEDDKKAKEPKQRGR